MSGFFIKLLFLGPLLIPAMSRACIFGHKQQVTRPSNGTLNRGVDFRFQIRAVAMRAVACVIYSHDVPPNGSPNIHLESRLRVVSLAASDQKYELC
jgi:hypothetical protein